MSRKTMSQHQVLEGLVQALWVSLVGFDPHWRVVVWNRRAESIFGLTAEEAIGRRLERTGILPDPSQGVIVEARIERAGDLVLVGEAVRGERKKWRTLVHRFRRIEGNRGEHRGFLCASDYKEVPESAEPSKDDLFGMVRAATLMRGVGTLVHDLQSPLQVILNRSEQLLGEEARRHGPADSRLQAIARATEDLSALIRRLGRLTERVEIGPDVLLPAEQASTGGPAPLDAVPRDPLRAAAEPRKRKGL